MKTTKRFDRAIDKLYTAFHNGTLDAMDCQHCAVGNLCDNSMEWVNTPAIGTKYRITFKQRFDTSFTGYSREELTNIETMFLYGVKDFLKRPTIKTPFVNQISNSDVEYGTNTKQEQKELQFKGLCAVIEYLAELDNIPNPLDYTKVFEQELETI